MHKSVTDPERHFSIRGSLAASLVLFSGLLLPTAGQAAEPVGVFKFARGDINVEAESGETRKASRGDDLMQNELILTGAGSIAVIQLADDSRMVLRPNSEFRVDLLDRDDETSDSRSQQRAELSLLRGGLRLITGLISRANPSGYRLSSPVATIGIRGTEFNARICAADCSGEENRIAGSDAAEAIAEGLYVNVDEGRVFLGNDASGGPLELDQGESGYVADSNTLPVRLALVPAFLSLDPIPSPGLLDFDNIQIPDDVFEAIQPVAEAPEAMATASEEITTEVELSGTYAGFDVSGTYEIEVTYSAQLPLAARTRYWGSSPDIEFTLTQDGDRMSGEFSGDMDGTIEGVVDGDRVTFEFLLEARGGELKSGEGSWIIQDDGSLQGDFNIRDPRDGIVRGRWTLTPIEASGSSAFGADVLLFLMLLGWFVRPGWPGRRQLEYGSDPG